MEDQTQLEIIRKDLDKYGAIDVVANHEGGRILIESLTQDVLASVNTLRTQYKRLTLPEFIAHSASLAANMDIIDVLTRAEKNKKLAKDALEAALQH